MKSFFILMTMCFYSFYSYAQNPFDNFIGDYKVVNKNCKSSSPLFFADFSNIKIDKGDRLGVSNNDSNSTFIKFEYETSSAFNATLLNLSLVYEKNKGVISSPNGVDAKYNAEFEGETLTSFVISHTTSNLYSFYYLSSFTSQGVLFHDECSYTLEAL